MRQVRAQCSGDTPGPGRQGLEVAQAGVRSGPGVHKACLPSQTLKLQPAQGMPPFSNPQNPAFSLPHPVQWLSMIFRSTKSKTECANTCMAGAETEMGQGGRGQQPSAHTPARRGAQKRGISKGRAQASCGEWWAMLACAPGTLQCSSQSSLPSHQEPWDGIEHHAQVTHGGQPHRADNRLQHNRLQHTDKSRVGKWKQAAACEHGKSQCESQRPRCMWPTLLKRTFTAAPNAQ